MNCNILNCSTQSYIPQTSTTFYPQNELFDLEMAPYLAVNGTFQGAWSKEELNLGNLELTGMDFMLLDKASLLRPLQYIASVGVGRSDRSAMPHLSIVEILYAANVITKQQFSISCTPQNATIAGRIIFGESSPTEWVGTLKYQPVYKPEMGYWSMLLTKISTNGTTLNLTANAILDTTMPFIAAPVADFMSLCAALGITNIMPSTPPGTFFATVPCASISTFPDIKMSFNGTYYKFKNTDYLRPGAGGVCYFYFVGADIAPPKGPAWILGELFMSGRFILYDLDNTQIGIAPSTLTA